MHDGVPEPDGSSASSWGSPCEGEGTRVVDPERVAVSDTDTPPRGAKAKLGEVIARSRISESANHIIGNLSTALDQESPECKVSTLGWTKGDCAFERGERKSEGDHIIQPYTIVHFVKPAS